ncbi:MAG: bifunctional phosphoribosyl-AMP cyclohydrolase/phosphoribosyl-ATP diphosphatase HisIE [Longimicrobiales bacterium]
MDGAAALDHLDFDRSGGLLPVVAQHARTGEVLMVAWADRDALERALREERMWYYSRSRNALWRKGETSGNGQRLVALFADCDGDTVLALVDPEGPSCHTGEWTCFGAAPTLAALAATIEARTETAHASSYTRRLLDDSNLRLKKLGEEAVELVVACRDGDAGRAAAEAADLIYHALVACRPTGTRLDDVLQELDRRQGLLARRPHEDQPVDAEQDERAEDRDRE